MTESRHFHLHNGQTGAAIAVRVTTRASKNEIQEILDDGTIKIRITSAPVDGQANETLLEYLAKLLDVKVSQLDIVAGQTGRDKLISVIGLDADTVQERIVKQVK
ncbi:uncharacterized conserved protein [Longilinea arvoryzae]|uniref:UPF0235 protein LARV_02516 n=1 Tax=Longilinea arvoryzae TaxID=360412 RepID=A0A0S7BLU4_9CHLR|nr:DUF167 domain-containing protein [Longilinea arvoryzae]GAP14741.1 uncharacterized conserved protein [Longilinea arvoryzae]